MKTIAAFAILLVVTSCNKKKVDIKAEGEKVMQISKEWSDVAATGNVEKTINYWVDDAFFMSAGQAPLQGKTAIRQMVEESFKTPGFRISWQPQTVEVSASGDMAYMIENSQVSFTDSSGKPVVIKNKAVSIWRKQADGTWKNAVDISAPDPSQH